MNPRCSRRHRTNQTGVSLVELMVAITLGLVVTAGLVTLFVNNSRTNAEIENANRQIENGLYATELLSEDLRLAGYLGEFDPTVLATPATKPDPCSALLSDLRNALPLHVQGYDNGASPGLSCLSDVRPGTDILVVRHVSTCVAGLPGCDPVRAWTPYFQASLCRSPTQLGSASPSDYYRLDTDTTKLDRQKNDCLATNLANLRRYHTHIYFIANNDRGSDGIPTLKRAELGPNAAGTAMDFSTVVPLVEGIENLQIEYGIDTANTGAPGLYTADPDNVPACAGVACVTNWRNVVAVKLYVLARNASPRYTDTKAYTLGLKADGVSAKRLGPYNDAFKRHLYQAVVRLNNPADRKTP